MTQPVDATSLGPSHTKAHDHIYDVAAHWGGVPDGTTDNQPFVQNAATQAGADGGGIVLCRGGTWAMGNGAANGSRVTVPSNVKVIGWGRSTIFKAKAALTHANQGIFYAPDATGVEFRDFDIDGNRANIANLGAPTTNQFGIYANAASVASNVRIDNVDAYATWGCGIQANSTIPTSTVTVTTTLNSRLVTVTAGTIAVADIGKRVSIAGVSSISALTGTPDPLLSYITDRVDATHFYMARKARTAAAGKTMTIYSPYGMTANILNSRSHGCGGLGVYMTGNVNTVIRNLYAYDNLSDGVQINGGLSTQMTGIHTDGNTGNGLALANCFRSNVSGVEASRNTVWGSVFSLGCVDFNAQNFVCNTNGGGFDIDVAEVTGDNITQETRGQVHNVTANQNTLYHGISTVQAEHLSFSGVSAAGNGNGAGAFINGRSIQVHGFNFQDNLFGVNMPNLVTLVASGFHNFGLGTCTANGTDWTEGAAVAGTVKYASSTTTHP